MRVSTRYSLFPGPRKLHLTRFRLPFIVEHETEQSAADGAVKARSGLNREAESAQKIAIAKREGEAHACGAG